MTQTRRRFLAGAGGAIALPAFAPLAYAQSENILPPAIAQSPYVSVESVQTDQARLALTFDDGPHKTRTPRLLDMLAEANMKATFFIVGQRAQHETTILRRISDEGHEIGNHSWTHPFLNKLSDTAAFREIDRTSELIFDVTGRAPVVFRPPYGAFSDRQKNLLRETRGMPSILWSVDPLDWRRPGSGVIAQRIINGIHPGAIVLSHDIHSGTINAMPAVLQNMRERGYRAQTMSELLGWPNWHSLRFERL